MFAGFVLTTFSAPPQILGCIDSFLLPNSRNEEMMGDSLGATYVKFCFVSKRLLSTSCNKQGQRSKE